MEETFVASRHLRQEIYVFKNKVSYENLEYFRPPDWDRTRPPILIVFKGVDFLNGHFMALIPKENQSFATPPQGPKQMEIEKDENIKYLPHRSILEVVTHQPSRSKLEQPRVKAPTKTLRRDRVPQMGSSIVADAEMESRRIRGYDPSQNSRPTIAM